MQIDLNFRNKNKTIIYTIHTSIKQRRLEKYKPIYDSGVEMMT